MSCPLSDLFRLAMSKINDMPVKQGPVHGEFVMTLRLVSGTDRGNGTAKRSGQGRHGRAAVRETRRGGSWRVYACPDSGRLSALLATRPAGFGSVRVTRRI